MPILKPVAAIIALLIATPALAQQPPAGTMAPMPGMPMHNHPAATAEASPSSQAFKAADAKMMQDMDRTLSGNTDQDFVSGMLPHHQGAVDMAKIELQYGHDPELLKLARDIIAAQDKEIAFMQAWQKAHKQP